MRRLVKVVGAALGVVVVVLGAYEVNNVWREYRFRASWITQVSLIQLIATPERFDHKRVAVNGFLYCERQQEVCGIFLSKDDLEHGNSDNGVEVNFYVGNFTHGEWKGFSGRYVRLVGRFVEHANSQWVIKGESPALGEIEQLKYRPEAPIKHVAASKT